MVARADGKRGGRRAPASGRTKRDQTAPSTRPAKHADRDPRPPAPAPAAAAASDVPAARAKLVRDSFTMPKTEYSVLAELKLRAAKLGRPIKKGELLRAGVAALRSMPDRSFLAALSVVPILKPGRPKGGAAAEQEPPRPRGKKHRKSA